jgi:hypothetical protein
MGSRSKELIVEIPFIFTANKFPAFPAEYQFCNVAATGFPLLADSGNWHTATNSFKLQRGLLLLLAQKRQAYYCYQLVGFPL